MKHVTAIAVAEAIIRLGNKEDKPLTPMALLKLVYLCHGWSLALRGELLIREEVEAWQYGPVVPELYHAVKEFRSNAVIHISTGGGAADKLSDEQESLVGSVYDSYKHLSGTQLSVLTHQPGTPWSETWNKGGKNATIPTSLIEEHFKELAG
ncbi:MAG: hypothetical protein COB78_09970 [Hyphomicrobiales bacterium]|nr:MAG: hypothetical protein COB78_09970 [Hyphomicrobiales bacterium]